MALLAIAPFVVNLLIVGFLFICVTLVLLVLIQRPQGGGLSGAFGAGGGGGGAGQTAFGTKTGDALTMATIGVFVLYLLVAIGLIFAARPQNINAVTQPAITAPGADVPTEDEAAAIIENAETAADEAGAALESAAEESAGEAAESVDDVINDLTGDAPAEPTGDQPE